MAYYRTMRSL